MIVLINITNVNNGNHCKINNYLCDVYSLTFQIGLTDTTCYELIDDYKDVISQAKFLMEGVGILAVGIFGLIGNIFSIFIHRRSRGNKGFHTLLIL